jgi:tetratricopeptide (TPR) repeat protein
MHGCARAASALALIAVIGSRPARADVFEALAAYKAGRYLEAVAEIQAVVDQSPGYDWGYFLLGHCMLKMRRVGEAELQFRRALRLDPSKAVYYHGFALALAASGNWPLMIRAADEGLTRAQDPRMRFALLVLRGYASGALRRWNDAVRDLEAAQRLHTDAVAPLRQVLQLAPDDPVVLRFLAESFLRMAAEEEDPVRKRFNYLQSLGYAQRLASVTPDDLAAIHLVGRAALGAGRLEQAENVFRHVLAINPRQCYALANLGRTYMAVARWTEAEAYLRNASACAPRLPTVYESLGELYLEVGKPQEAAEMFRRADEIEPTRHATQPPGSMPVFQPR